MNDAEASAERIDLDQTEDPRDAVHRAVACLGRGGVIGLPVGFGYTLAASALWPEAVQRLTAGQGPGTGRASGPETNPPRLWLNLVSTEALPDWVPGVDPMVRRVAHRGWPGPLALILEGSLADGLIGRLPESVRSALVPAGQLTVTCPDHPFLGEVGRLLADPVILAEPFVARGQPVTESDGLLAAGAGPDLLIDGGPMPETSGPTIVRVEQGRLVPDRIGLIDEQRLRQLAGHVIVFVCTGNTCRSPMAEALFKVLLAEQLGCPADALEQHGWFIRSAGLSAADGAPAAHHAVSVVQSMGGSLEHHASRRLTPEMARLADAIIVMTRDHLDLLTDIMPETADHARLLDPNGGDIGDPVGADVATYRATAETIRNHLVRLLDEWAQPSPRH